MAVCRAMSLSLLGIEAVAVEVEVDVSAGLPRFSIVGLPDAAVQEARERVRVAISNSGFRFPTKKVIVNLAPANLRKEGAAFDLPIALAILAAAGEVSEGEFCKVRKGGSGVRQVRVPITPIYGTGVVFRKPLTARARFVLSAAPGATPCASFPPLCGVHAILRCEVVYMLVGQLALLAP
jgi:hypothetical protein